MNLYSRSNARRSLIDTVAFRAVSQISTMLGYIILVRGMTEQDFGVLSLLYAFIWVVATVASLGLQPTLMRYQPEYLRAGNLAAAAWLVRVVASARLMTNIVVLSVILIGWNYIAPLFKLAPDHRSAFVGVCVLILLHFQTSLMQQALASHMLHRYSVGSTALLSITKLVVYGGLFLSDALSLRTAIATDILAYAVAYMSMRVVYQRKCLTADARTAWRPDPTERRRLVRYALFNNFNDAGMLLMSGTVDSFFIAAFVSTTGVGAYSFYSRLRQMVGHGLPGRLFDNVVRPLFFSVPAVDAGRKIPAYFSFLLNINLLVLWPALAFSIVYHAEIVQAVFGGKFIAHSWLLPTLMAFFLMNCISEPTSLVAQYEEKVGVVLLSKLFAIYNVLAMAAMVPVMGIYGAALASGTTQIMKNVFIWWHVRHRAVWTNWRAALPVSLLLWGAGVAVCYGLKTLMHVPPLIHLCIGAMVLASVGLLHVRSAALSSSDRAILAAVTAGRAARVLQYVGVLSRASKT